MSVVAVPGQIGRTLDVEGTLVFLSAQMQTFRDGEVPLVIREQQPELPVILVTGWGTTLSKDEVERCGISAVVHKPFEIQELLDTASEVLQRNDRRAGIQS